MTFKEWLDQHPICPRTAELQACWEAAQAAVIPKSPQYRQVGYGWFDDHGNLAGALDENREPLFVHPLYVLVGEREERRKHG